jgi:hypothetical protein
MASTAPITIASYGAICVRSARLGGGEPAVVAMPREVAIRLATRNRASSSAARLTNVDIHDGRGS